MTKRHKKKGNLGAIDRQQRVELRLCAVRPQRREVVDTYRCHTQNTLIACGYLHVIRGEDVGVPEHEHVCELTELGKRTVAPLLKWLSHAEIERHGAAEHLKRARSYMVALAATTTCKHERGDACAHCQCAAALAELEAHQIQLFTVLERNRMLEEMAGKIEKTEAQRAAMAATPRAAKPQRVPGNPILNIKHMRARLEKREKTK